MRLLISALVTVVLAVPASIVKAADLTSPRTLDGSQNNTEHPDWGQANTAYPRVAAPRYLDGRATPVPGPPARYISNRIFNDTAQNLFSENGVTQWGAVWGQFLDHTFGLRQVNGGESAPMAFDPADPLEAFRNDLGTLAFTRTPAAAGTGASSPREQSNTVSGYIDASTVYGDSAERLQWLRESGDQGPKARLLLPGGYLPSASARGDASTAPPMELVGRLAADPSKAMVAGDARANENMSLAAVQTLFALEHNRIVGALPRSLPEEEKFQIARRLVGAEQQFITYEEFLPSLGVALSGYRGYDPQVNASITNEFAVVGYRAHSMIHGEFEPHVPRGTFSEAELDAFSAQGIKIERVDDSVVLVVPLNLSFGNPELLRKLGLGTVLRTIGTESEYKNDEQIDNQLRSVLFQVPKPGSADPAQCLDGPPLPQCFAGVVDLAATDIERGRDHGMPTYNALREAYGLQPKQSFTAITGESTERLPAARRSDASDQLDDPGILDFMTLADRSGKKVELGTPAATTDAVTGVRRTTTAARLRGIYDDVANVDAFVGMSAEQHVPGAEFGELQLAIWKRQFEALRSGDRFFYLADPELASIERKYGLTYRHTLTEVIQRNTHEDVQPNVFKLAD
jgi:hypothetical protein